MCVLKKKANARSDVIFGEYGLKKVSKITNKKGLKNKYNKCQKKGRKQFSVINKAFRIAIERGDLLIITNTLLSCSMLTASCFVTRLRP